MAEWSAQRVRARTRAAVRKREEQIETEEMEGGELNLIPYLDMTTNLMLFILVQVSAGLILAQLNTTLPDKAPKGASAQKPDQSPEEQPLGLYVSIQQKDMVLWSVSKREGTLKSPKDGYVFPRLTGTMGTSCDGPYMCESNLCTDGVCAPSAETPQPVYDYRKLNQTLYNIARTHYAPEGQPQRPRKADSYTIVLQADGSVPYSVIVSVMAAMRCKLPAFGEEARACLLPNENKVFKASNKPYDNDEPALRRSYNTEKVPYDPDAMALFPQIQFSSGFE
jgi:biopolymer transport protein ExbD